MVSRTSPQEDGRRESFWRWLIGILIAGGAINIIPNLIKEYRESENSAWCRMTIDTFQHRHLTYLNGFDGRPADAHYQVQDTKDIAVTDTANFFQKVRRPMMERLMSRIQEKMPYYVSSASLDSFQQKAYRKGRILNEEDFVNAIFYPEEQLEWTLDNGKCGLKYTLALRAPKDFYSVIPAEIRTACEALIANCDCYDQAAGLVGQSIDLSRIYPCLETHLQRLEELGRTYRSFTRLVPMPWMDNGQAKIYYDRGAYSLPGAYVLVVNHFLKKFETEIGRHPGAEYTIVCTGYASKEAVKDPIPYTAGGCFAEPGTEVILDPGVPCTAIPGYIDDNGPLSFARAFEVARYLNDNFNPELRGKVKLRFAYTGLGEDSVNQRYEYQRRVEIKLIKKSATQ